MRSEPGVVVVDSMDDVLSLHFPASFKVLNRSFLSAWHYVLYMKAKWLKRYASADRILALSTVDKLQEWEATLGDDQQPLWREQAWGTLEAANRFKFNEHPDMRTLLLGTGSALIVSTTHPDSYLSAPELDTRKPLADKRNWIGRNAEGIALMRVRDELLASPVGSAGPAATGVPVTLAARIDMCWCWEEEFSAFSHDTYRTCLAAIRAAPTDEVRHALYVLMRRKYWDVDLQHRGRAELLHWVHAELGFELPEDPSLSRTPPHG